MELFRKIFDCCWRENNNQSNIDKTICTICHNHIQPQQNTIQTPCGHSFHSNCMIRWSIENSSCPICRKPLRITASISNNNHHIVSIV